MNELSQKIKKICSENLIKIQINSPKNKNGIYKKAVLVVFKHGWQLQKYTQKQVFHENVLAENVVEVVLQLLEEDFNQLQAYTKDFEYGLRITSKGKVLENRKAQSGSKDSIVQPFAHNRQKNYILKEGIIPPLVDMGIFTTEGKVANAMYDKYKQINRFVELIDDAVAQQEQKNPFRIIDFGCGKSYLTFILYYYFTEIKKIKVEMIGLDLKQDVVEKCNKTAQKYGYSNLVFEVGDIAGYTPKQKPDMVISLHACDTATDHALFHGVEWGAKYIFSVPCCQHELNSQMQVVDLSLFTRYGLVQERVSALMTDAMRANLLQACGYKTQLIEFVGFEHTPKNILIRAVQSNLTIQHKKKVLQEVKTFCATFSADPTLLTLLTPLLQMQNLL